LRKHFDINYHCLQLMLEVYVQEEPSLVREKVNDSSIWI